MTEIETVALLSPTTADNVARVLDHMLANTSYICANDIDDFEAVRDALYALGNDTDAILCADTFPRGLPGQKP